MAITLIGIDCATQAKKVGLAYGIFEGGKAHIGEAAIGSKEVSIVDTIVDWVAFSSSTLIAIDAPLGWPISLGQELHGHIAGKLIQTEPDEMFSRLTDHVIRSEVGKKPLEVGANLIARTAHAALTLLETLRNRTGEAIPLAWKPPPVPGTFAIEVYPAATLKVCGIEVADYKKKDGREARRALLELLQNHIILPADTSLMESNDDALDAVICVLAGADFLRGEVIEPTNIKIARKEGWIWVRKPT